MADVNHDNVQSVMYSSANVAYALNRLSYAYPFLTNEQLSWLLLSSAKNIDESKTVPNKIYGWGALDLNKALGLFSKPMKGGKTVLDYNRQPYDILLSFRNELEGKLVLKPIKSIAKRKVVSNFNGNGLTVQNFDLTIGKNNIVLYQYPTLAKGKRIVNNGMLFIDEKANLDKQIVNKEKGVVHKVDFNTESIISLKQKFKF